MPSPETRAHARYLWLKRFLREEKECSVSRYESLMMDVFGVLPRTVAVYIKSMSNLGFIKCDLDNQKVTWIGERHG